MLEEVSFFGLSTRARLALFLSLQMIVEVVAKGFQIEATLQCGALPSLAERLQLTLVEGLASHWAEEIALLEVSYDCTLLVDGALWRHNWHLDHFKCQWADQGGCLEHRDINLTFS